MIDSRHNELAIDKSVDEFLEHIKKNDQIVIKVFTKIDKLTQSDLHKLRQKYPDGIFVSHLKKKGIEDLEERISKYLFGE